MKDNDNPIIDPIVMIMIMIPIIGKVSGNNDKTISIYIIHEAIHFYICNPPLFFHASPWRALR